MQKIGCKKIGSGILVKMYEDEDVVPEDIEKDLVGFEVHAQPGAFFVLPSNSGEYRVVSLEGDINEEELRKTAYLAELEMQMTAVSRDIIQDLCGELVPDLAEKKRIFIEAHRAYKELIGGTPRTLKDGVVIDPDAE